MQRLNIEKNEAVADLIERILEVEDQEIVLVVPKNSRLVDSPSNFRLIAREAGVLAKVISVESVDQEALEQAKSAGLTANHPLFGDRAKAGDDRSLSDIQPRRAKTRAGAEKKLKVNVEPEPEEEEEEEEVVEVSAEAEEDIYEEEEYKEEDSEEEEEERYDTLEGPRRGRGRKVLIWTLIAALIIAGGMWFVAYAFGKATVDIAFNESPWTHNGVVTASVLAKNLDAETATIPAEMVEQPQNLSVRSFPATGRTTGGQKARGTITIVNEHSASSQELVATTRFTTPDGKIYRLDNGTIVPGATVDASGKVTASSSIKAAVTADQSGESYNIGATPHLNIPGFQGTPKYTGFYGVLSEGASGGTSTGGPSPTAEDISKAKAEMASALSSSFQATFLAGVPEGLKVLPEALVFSTTTFSIGPVDERGQFSVTPSSILRAFEFRESDVEAFLNAKAQSGNPGKILQDLKISYASVKPDFAKKQLTFSVQAEAVLAPEFDPAAFASTIAGKSQDQARESIQLLPELASAKVSLWPSWLWVIPNDPSKISVNVR